MSKYDLIGALLDRDNEKPSKHGSTIKNFLAIIGAVAIIAGIVYAIYRFLTPDYMKNLDSDFDDDFDDFFEEETADTEE